MAGITSVEPCGKMVLLRFYEVKSIELFKVNKSGLLMPNEKSGDDKKKHYALVDKIGPDLKAEELTFKVGDRVFYNDYDCKIFGDEENTFGLTKAESIWAVYKED